MMKEKERLDLVFNRNGTMNIGKQTTSVVVEFDAAAQGSNKCVLDSDHMAVTGSIN
jgi:uncharacterized metal-binding protein